MNGTKKQSSKVVLVIKVVIILIIIAVIGKTIKNESRVEVMREEVSSEDNFEVSYLEGMSLGVVYRTVTLYCLEGKVTVQELDKLQYYIDKTLDDISERNVKRAYVYAAKVLNTKISFLHHEGVDKEAYTDGCLDMMSMNMLWLMSEEGEIPKEEFEELRQLFLKVYSNATRENIEQFEEVLLGKLSEWAGISEQKEEGNYPPPFV